MPDGGFVAHLAPSGDPFSNGWNAAMKLQASQPTSCCLPMPVNVIFHNPATIVFWDDGDKTVVKCQPGDTFSAEAGLTAAMLKKYMGNDNTFNKVINERSCGATERRQSSTVKNGAIYWMPHSRFLLGAVQS